MLTVNLGSWVICSAHGLTKRNILVKFHGNRSKGSGDKERTLISKVNPLTLTCDLEPRSLGHVLCTPSH